MFTTIKSFVAVASLALLGLANQAHAGMSFSGVIFPFSRFFGAAAWEVYFYSDSDSYFDALFFQGLGVWSPFCFYDQPGGFTYMEEQCFTGGSDQDFVPLFHAYFYDSRLIYGGEEFCGYATHVQFFWGNNGSYEFRTPRTICAQNPWFFSQFGF